MLFNDPRALAETSHLDRIGMILMDIALGTTPIVPGSEFLDKALDEHAKLSLIEQSIGKQYSQAVAFCLQKNRPMTKELRSPRKYDSRNFDKWIFYLSELLKEYYSEVYLR